MPYGLKWYRNATKAVLGAVGGQVGIDAAITS